jgi:hypothetical protein
MVAEGIFELPRPIAVELILDRSDLLRARFDRTGEHVVDVLDVDHEEHRRATELLRGRRARARERVRQHDHGVADLDLGVPDLAVGALHPHALRRAEHVTVELDGRGRAVDAEVRDHPRVFLGNRVDLGHGSSSGRFTSPCDATTATSMRQPSRRHRQARRFSS